MRIFLFASCLFSYAVLQAQEPLDSSVTLAARETFYTFFSEENKELIVFLHGGVNNPIFKSQSDDITPDVLLEHNQNFVEQANQHAYDVLIPVTNENLNWLTQPEHVFQTLKAFIVNEGKHYDAVYIAGFSDGGTGAYKIFYTHPEYFSGLLVFNGYPQHKNFYQHAQYADITDKTVFFFSTRDDQTIPYEFLMTEYCAQKKTNPNTFLYLSDGGHSFSSYDTTAFNELFSVLNGTTKNHQTDPIHGYVKNDQPITIYRFRKKIVRKYNYGQEIYELNQQQLEQYGHLVD